MDRVLETAQPGVMRKISLSHPIVMVAPAVAAMAGLITSSASGQHVVLDRPVPKPAPMPARR